MLNGKPMRVPKIVFGGAFTPEQLAHQPFVLDHLGLTLWYPEMTLTSFALPERQTATHFKVFLPWTVYRSDHPARYESANGLLSPDIGFDDDIQRWGDPHRSETKFADLVSIDFHEVFMRNPVFRKDFEAHPDVYGGNSVRYLSKSKAAFEADIGCGKVNYCRGHVFIKTPGLQYSMTFGRPGGTKEIMNVINAVNRMYTDWSDVNF
ncbi:MAG: hypothetical protein JO006_12335 [Paucibacter sp.]|nr:hypothetical protein [Roseateles sp.]